MGHRLARGDWVGQVPADLQVDVESIVKLAHLAEATSTPMIFKIRRRFRLESPLRRVISVTFNVLTQLMFGSLGSMDINANPKLIPSMYLKRMNLRSTDWFIDVEIMIKSKAMGLGIVELNAFSQIRVAGRSNIRALTAWEFIRNLVSHRWGPKRRVLDIRSERAIPAGIDSGKMNRRVHAGKDPDESDHGVSLER